MRKKKSLVVISFIILVGVLFHWKNINEFPSYTHAWAQADRYAISLGFLDNNLNFFKPQTYILNHQFPHNFKVPSENGVTAVDFPIHDFIPALWMKLLGTTSPWVFRLYILLYSFIGLFFLFKTSRLMGNDFLKSIIILTFAVTVPVFVYYQNSFLPTIPSFSNAIIGLFFYLHYVKSQEKKSFIWCLVFLTLATLSRTTFAIPLIAIFGIELLYTFKSKKVDLYKIGAVLSSIAVIVIYLFYNAYLRNQYGSVFLNHMLPAENLSQIKKLSIEIYQKWKFHYFTPVHYLMILLTFGLSFYFTRKREKQGLGLQKRLLFLVLINLLGSILFALLMLQQFRNHDYYFIDVFLIPMLFLMIYLWNTIPSNLIRKNLLIAVPILALILLSITWMSFDLQKDKRATGSWDKIMTTAINFEGTDSFLDNLNISREAKVLVLDAVAPNIPLTKMKRKGYVVLTTSKENIERSLSWPYDYVAIQNEFFLTDIYPNFPKIITKLKKVANNGKVSFYVLLKEPVNSTLTEFLNIHEMTPLLSEVVNFDTTEVSNSFWSNLLTVDSIAYSGKKSGFVPPEKKFGITYKTIDLPLLKKQKTLLYVKSHFLKIEDLSNCQLAVSITENGKSIYFKSHDLSNMIKTYNNWEEHSLIFNLPKVNSDDYEFAVFIWNQGKNQLFYDDFGYHIY